MKILISNDDGYTAPGIRVLAESLKPLGDIVVVAPEYNRSAASNSLTVASPLRTYTADNGFIYVNGTPADCVHLAITGLLDAEPDIVVAGINDGANMGEDVLYSGTVGAAMEGRYLGSPAIAVSMCSLQPRYYQTAGRVACDLIRRLQRRTLMAETVLNVNVPDLPYDALAGYMMTRCGRRHRSEPVIKSQDPRGRDIYWVGSPGPEADAGEGTDFYAVAQGYVSITPLRIDMTHRRLIPVFAEWLEETAG